MTPEELLILGIGPQYRNDNHKIVSWDDYFMQLVLLISKRSKDSNTQHGCLAVKDRIVIATGFNSFPPGADDKNLPNTRLDNKKYDFINHAEESMIFSAAKRGVALDGATLYCTGLPCHACTRKLISVGILNWVVGPVIHLASNREKLLSKYWIEWYNIKIRYYNEFGTYDQSSSN